MREHVVMKAKEYSPRSGTRSTSSPSFKLQERGHVRRLRAVTTRRAVRRPSGLALPSTTRARTYLLEVELTTILHRRPPLPTPAHPTQTHLRSASSHGTRATGRGGRQRVDEDETQRADDK